MKKISALKMEEVSERNFLRDEFLMAKEAAAYLHVSYSYIRQLTHRKAITYYKMRGGRVLFRVRDLEEYISRSMVKSVG